MSNIVKCNIVLHFVCLNEMKQKKLLFFPSYTQVSTGGLIKGERNVYLKRKQKRSRDEDARVKNLLCMCHELCGAHIRYADISKTCPFFNSVLQIYFKLFSPVMRHCDEFFVVLFFFASFSRVSIMLLATRSFVYNCSLSHLLFFLSTRHSNNKTVFTMCLSLISSFFFPR